MIEEIKTLGSIVGLLTGVFTIWDKYCNGRPIVSLSVSDEGIKKPSPRIRIKNVGSHDICILSINGIGRGLVSKQDLHNIIIKKHYQR